MSNPEPAPSAAIPSVAAPRVIRDFLRTEAAGGMALLVATSLALAWANSPWDKAYESLWTTELSIRLGRGDLSNDLRHWVNDGLMTVFFFVVGLEIKRELVTGELRRWRTAALPAVAAVGGMVVPAAIYLAFNAGSGTMRGWGIPMATDIAFALAVVALLGDRVPSAAKLFLLTLAIVDDIGAIVVIAAFYSGGVQWPALGVAVLLLLGMLALRRARVRSMAPFALVGVGVWLAVYQSGVHATLAGVVLGLLAPARPLASEGVAQNWAGDLQEDPSPENLRLMTQLARTTVSVAERLERELHPWTSFLVVPVFALANAGIRLDPGAVAEAATSAVGVGVAAGLVVGKLAGITGTAWLAVRLGLTDLPTGTGWRHILGVATVAGIGFTVSLFIADLALAPRHQASAKIGILAASLVASAGGFALLRRAGREGAATP